MGYSIYDHNIRPDSVGLMIFGGLCEGYNPAKTLAWPQKAALDQFVLLTGSCMTYDDEPSVA